MDVVVHSLLGRLRQEDHEFEVRLGYIKTQRERRERERNTHTHTHTHTNRLKTLHCRRARKFPCASIFS
jgi:hypothetical protein